MSSAFKNVRIESVFMKKALISAIVVMSFLTYAISIHKKEAMPIIVSKTISKTSPLPSSSPTSVPPTPLPPTAAPVLQKTTKQLQPTPTAIPVVIPTATPKPTSPFRDGTYNGSVADAFYGNIQVQVTVAGGRITNIQFLQYPNDRGESIAINQQADPMLAQEATQAQSANVDVVSGATQSSQAFVQSMQSALDQAKS